MTGGSFDSSPLNAEQRKKGCIAIEAALECGLNFFDHADTYCFGKSEIIFGEFLAENPNLRDELILQSKCCQGAEVELSRIEWYQIYSAAMGHGVP